MGLRRGDLLGFSANMIHRGIYGDDRLALDILLCENDPDILKYANLEGPPHEVVRAGLEWPEVFPPHNGPSD